MFIKESCYPSMLFMNYFVLGAYQTCTGNSRFFFVIIRSLVIYFSNDFVYIFFLNIKLIYVRFFNKKKKFF